MTDAALVNAAPFSAFNMFGSNVYDRLNFLARMPGGSGIYSKTRDLMIIPRISYADIKAGRKLSDLSAGILPEEVEATQRLAAQMDALMPPAKVNQ
jgi:hypothetical protein